MAKYKFTPQQESTLTESIAIARFISFVDSITDPPSGVCVLNEDSVACFRAAASRLKRQQAAVRRAGETRSAARAEAARSNGQSGGRPRHAEPSKAALAKRKERAKDKQNAR